MLIVCRSVQLELGEGFFWIAVVTQTTTLKDELFYFLTMSVNLWCYALDAKHPTCPFALKFCVVANLACIPEYCVIARGLS